MSVSCGTSRREWRNTDEEDPCRVAIQLGRVCDAGFDLLPLPPYQGYYPIASPPESCLCNAVGYNLIQACQYCQPHGLYRTYNEYVANCTTDTAVPGTAGDVNIPTWAWLDTRTSGFSLAVPDGEITLTLVSGLPTLPASSSTVTSPSQIQATATPSSTVAITGLATSLASAGDLIYTITTTDSRGRTYTSTGLREQYTPSGDGDDVPTGGRGTSVAPIAGAIAGVIGGVLVMWLLGGVALLSWTKRRRQEMRRPLASAYFEVEAGTSPPPHPPQPSPTMPLLAEESGALRPASLPSHFEQDRYPSPPLSPPLPPPPMSPPMSPVPAFDEPAVSPPFHYRFHAEPHADPATPTLNDGDAVESVPPAPEGPLDDPSATPFHYRFHAEPHSGTPIPRQPAPDVFTY